MYKRFYIFFKIILNKRFLVFKIQGLYFHELIYRKWVNLQNPNIRMKVREKVKFKVTGAQPGVFSGQDRFLETEAL